MGMNDAMLCLYTDLQNGGLFAGIDSVAELGSQTLRMQNPERLEALLTAFNRPLPPPEELARFIGDSAKNNASLRTLYGYLGFERYTSIDIDAAHGAIAIDLNFDEVPEEHHGAYGLTTNLGTSEHILNQANVFKVIHDLTAPGGLMLNVNPFIGFFEHGFFNYQPNFFQAIARYNAYEMLGLWVNHEPNLEFVPLVEWWGPRNRVFEVGQDYLLVTLSRKTQDAPFFMPVQGHYEAGLPPASRARYRPL